MANFAKDPLDSSNEELKRLINHTPPDFASLASDELTRRELKALQGAIEKNTVQAKELGNTNERFSKLFVVLTFIQLMIAWSQFVLDGVKSFLGFFMLIATIIFGILAFNTFIPKKKQGTRGALD